jgi:hypothetical protein
MGRTNTVESVSSTPMPGLNSSWASVMGVGFEANGLGLRGLRVNIVQCDHETKLVTDLADVDARFLPAILLTSVE